jgi:hypothetical protein
MCRVSSGIDHPREKDPVADAQRGDRLRVYQSASALRSTFRLTACAVIDTHRRRGTMIRYILLAALATAVACGGDDLPAIYTGSDTGLAAARSPRPKD